MLDLRPSLFKCPVVLVFTSSDGVNKTPQLLVVSGERERRGFGMGQDNLAISKQCLVRVDEAAMPPDHQGDFKHSFGLVTTGNLDFEMRIQL